MKIKEWHKTERPREKLLMKGTESLSNTELLAIILRTGGKNANVIDMAGMLISSAGGSLQNLSSMPVTQMMNISGIGKDKAATVIAALELGRRFTYEQSSLNKTSITSSKMVFDLMNPKLKGLDHEECWVMFLNRANYVISCELCSKGGLDSTIIDTKTIARKSLERKASAVILIHNHPSGNPAPSNSDKKQTILLKTALESLDISLLDHIIYANDRYYSFTDDEVSLI